MEVCSNCKEIDKPCACMRNICDKCGNPVGNITFTVCNSCWDIIFPLKEETQEELFIHFMDAVRAFNWKEHFIIQRKKTYNI